MPKPEPSTTIVDRRWPLPWRHLAWVVPVLVFVSGQFIFDGIFAPLFPLLDVGSSEYLFLLLIFLWSALMWLLSPLIACVNAIITVSNWVRYRRSMKSKGSGAVAKNPSAKTWIVCAVSSVVFFAIYIVTLFEVLAKTVNEEESNWTFALSIINFSSLVLALLLAPLSIVFMVQHNTAKKAMVGGKTPAAQLRDAGLWWGTAKYHVSSLIAGRDIQFFEDQEIPHEDNERIYARTRLTYARYSGSDSEGVARDTAATGLPAFVVGGLLAASPVPVIPRSPADESAVELWRDMETVDTVISNRRLYCRVGGQWRSFAYSDMRTVYPEVGAAAVVVTFDRAQPLLLAGAAAPVAAVHALHGVQSLQGLAQHPNMAMLR